ncbi:MAG: DUF342 domain-containing protein [SAR324 cluster bacterium]|uniref:DUF342 domain-containing protein n=1 Tax=SAR324 cluster bacterium TaxID=2024889 RepID=A0A7X9FTN3_9DELT|nr:DUF342 domain-containing protein [SAR324 cluster bacterium]
MKQIYSKKTDRIILTAKLDPENMKLFIDVERISEEPIARQDLLDIIKDFVKLDFVEMDVIQDIVERLNDPEAKEKIERERRIAKGKPAETGADGKLLLLVKALTGEIEMLHGEEGDETKAIVDFRNIHLFDNIEVGTIVGRIYEPKVGADGYDALGKAIPGKKGNPCKISLDKTLSTRPGQASGAEFTEVVAQAEGYVLSESGRLSIQPELVIKGNLDYHSGNLDFIGSVKILGDVMTGFRVSAKGNVEIRGMVRGENVLSSRTGDIVCSGYVYGGPDSKIVAAKSFHSVVMQEVNAEIGGDAFVKKEVVDSLLRIGGSLHIPEGALMGGVTHVVKGVEAKRLGNDAGQRTVIILCHSVEATIEYELLVNSIEDHNRAIELLKSHLGPLLSNPERIQFLNEELKSKMEKFFQKLKAVAKSREELLQRQSQMLQKASNDVIRRVNYKKTLYPGVVIVAGQVRYEVKDEKNGPGSIEFDPSKGEFVEVEYKELSPTSVASSAPKGKG